MNSTLYGLPAGEFDGAGTQPRAHTPRTLMRAGPCPGHDDGGFLQALASVRRQLRLTSWVLILRAGPNPGTQPTDSSLTGAAQALIRQPSNLRARRPGPQWTLSRTPPAGGLLPLQASVGGSLGSGHTRLLLSARLNAELQGFPGCLGLHSGVHQREDSLNSEPQSAAA